MTAPSRHPAQVTADRLGDLLYRADLMDHIDGRERDLLSQARVLLERLADELSGREPPDEYELAEAVSS